MKKQLMSKMTRSFSKAGFMLKKHSPEILVVGGIVGGVTSAVMACKATTKLSGILEESKEQIDTIHDFVEDHGFTEEYTEQDSKKDLALVYAQTGIKVAKLYGPAVMVGALSIASILGSTKILKKRNVSLAAAYKTLDSTFKDYRNRVVERFGERIDKELRYNIKAKEIEMKAVDENGNEKVVKETVDVTDEYDLSQYSDYAKFFDCGNPNWEKDSEYNLMFLKQQQRYANDLLQSKGYLFLNDVYDMLGIPRTKAGQVVGWLYDEENPIGDNYVDFGIYDIHKPAARDFVNGYERTILLDFNVDGNIWDKM